MGWNAMGWNAICATLDTEGQIQTYRMVAGPFWFRRSAQRAVDEMAATCRNIGFPTMVWIERAPRFHERAKALPAGCKAPPVAGGLIFTMSYQKDRK